MPASTSPRPAYELPTVLSWDNDVLAVDKPWGWCTHPGQGGESEADLTAWVRAAVSSERKAFSAAHRLDRETSGVVVFAHGEALSALGRQFAKGAVKKTYLALVFGQAADASVIDSPLQDDRRARALPAITCYERVAQCGNFALLRLEPQTGRKHQIRRHLAQVGLPIVGDERYGAQRFIRVPAAQLWGKRLWLHACRLEFPGPLAFDCPLPASLAAHWAALASASRGPTPEHGVVTEGELL